MFKTSYKYIGAIFAFLIVTVSFAANDKASAPASPASLASLLHDYDYIQGEINGLQQRAKKIEADIDTMDTDLTTFDSRMGEISDSMIQLRRTCGEYLLMARKLRKISPEISLMNSHKRIYQSIRRNGYINSDIFKAHRELRSLTDEYFSIFNEKERIRYLIDHESDLYAMYDDVMDRIETLGERAVNVMSLINPRRNEAEAIISTRNANAERLDQELASAYIMRVNRDSNKKGRQASDPSSDNPTTSTSTFESKMGTMLFPVSGKYNIVSRFGRYAHPEFEYITVYNPGIDIEAGAGAMARAVFPGKVESIFDIPGFNKVVVVSHGDYYTVYGNLTDIKVTEKMDVKDGQIVGSVISDNGHTVLHFEVRLGTDPLDPAMWLKL